MSNRVVYGNSFSLNGWPMVDQGSCVWIRVPGTNVSLQIREGEPAKILGAFAADFNAYVEPLRDADSACWTPTNSVATSNHLSGTACDFNWGSHPFRVSYAGFDQAKIATMRELLEWYEEMIWWGQDWTSPKDPMHLEMHDDTYGSENFARVEDFINRKIRADGFSTFRRDGTPAPPPPQLSKQDQYALAVIRAGQKRNISRKGICIALCVPPVETNWRNLANAGDPETKALPNDGIGADHDSAGLFQQRRAWGPASVRMNPELSAGLFYDGGQAGQRGLRAFNYDSDYQSPGTFAADVQQPAKQYRGRYQEHWDAAVALYNRLSTVSDRDPLEELLMSDLAVESLSLYATPGEPNIPIVRMLQAIDAAEHRRLVEDAARLGDADSLARIARVAAGQGKYRDPGAVNHARAVLAQIESSNPEALQQLLNGAS